MMRRLSLCLLLVFVIGCSATQDPVDSNPKVEKDTKGSVPGMGSFYIFSKTHRDSNGVVKDVSFDTVRVEQKYMVWEGYDSSWRVDEDIYSTGLRDGAEGQRKYHSLWSPDLTSLQEKDIWVDLPLVRWSSTVRDLFQLADSTIRVGTQNKVLSFLMVAAFDVETTIELAGESMLVSRIALFESARLNDYEVANREWTFWFSKDARSIVKIEQPSWKDPITGKATGSYTTELLKYELK